MTFQSFYISISSLATKRLSPNAFVASVVLGLLVPFSVWEGYRQATAGVLPASYVRADVNAAYAKVMHHEEAKAAIEWRRVARAVAVTPTGDKQREIASVEYWRLFDELRAEIEATGAVLAVAYIPADRYDRMTDVERQWLAETQHEAAARGLPYWNAHEVLDAHDPHDVTFLAKGDGHLNAYGMQLIADWLRPLIRDAMPPMRVRVTDAPDSLLGPFDADDAHTVKTRMGMWRMTANAQGFRMAGSLTFPKSQARALILGDSMTLGPGLEAHETFAALAGGDGIESINAGRHGFGVFHALNYWRDRGRLIDADLVVLCINRGDRLDVVLRAIDAGATLDPTFRAAYNAAMEGE